MNQLKTVLAIHNHQPVGNFDTVFADACERCYEPFLEVMEKHPSLKFTQHWTGPLLEWLHRHRPGFLERMKDLVRRGQLELLTGTYYEAILPITPVADVIGQIRKHREVINSWFGYRSRGMWVAERVWEPHLAGTLAEAGVEFVVLDDVHFRLAGKPDDELHGYHITEEHGRTLKIFPIDRTLRYTVPFRPVEETIQHFRSAAEGGGEKVMLHADDGEKFGIWPGTYDSVYGQGWLEAFCRALERESDWLITAHLGEFCETHPPRGRVYLPSASYPEMMKWSLPSDAFQERERFEEILKGENLYTRFSPFVQGGFWRNFLAKYPEANHLHKKMLRLSRRTAALGRQREVPPEVFDHLWAGQCNDTYWHGVFGGLYLPNLRHAVTESLLKAEALLDGLERLPAIRAEQTDMDCDGQDELLVESDRVNLYFSPSSGGSLVELDFKPCALNLVDTLGRREEGYHQRLRDESGRYRDQTNIHDGALAKEEGLKHHLVSDWYRHASLVDHVFGEGTTLASVARCEYSEMGDFVNQPYVASIWNGGKEGEITLVREGAVWENETPHRLRVKKTVMLQAGKDEMVVEYELQNLEKEEIRLWFGVEFVLGMMAGDAEDRYYEIDDRTLSDRRLRSSGEETGVKRWRAVDEWRRVETAFALSSPAALWRFPIETVSLSETGLERLYQSSVVIPHWRCRLGRGREGQFRVRIVQKLRELGPHAGPANR
jgi:alpha-amylase